MKNAQFLAITIMLSMISITLVHISRQLDVMVDKMDEVLTNAAECGDVDCDDGYQPI